MYTIIWLPSLQYKKEIESYHQTDLGSRKIQQFYRWCAYKQAGRTRLFFCDQAVLKRYSRLSWLASMLVTKKPSGLGVNKRNRGYPAAFEFIERPINWQKGVFYKGGRRDFRGGVFENDTSKTGNKTQTDLESKEEVVFPGWHF